MATTTNSSINVKPFEHRLCGRTLLDATFTVARDDAFCQISIREAVCECRNCMADLLFQKTLRVFLSDPNIRPNHLSGVLADIATERSSAEQTVRPCCREFRHDAVANGNGPKILELRTLHLLRRSDG